MRKIEDYIDLGTLTVMIITFVIFLIALFTRGFTHAILLESGVFLISVKFLLNHYKLSLSIHRLESQLTEQKKILEKIADKLDC